MERRTDIYFGPPGTGKTTTLLNRVEEALADGYDPARIGFVAFSKKAATEAKGRALERFPGLASDDLPWFRTLHSAAFALQGLKRADVMTREDWDELGAALGLTFRAEYGVEWAPVDPSAAATLGDRMVAVYALAQARRRPLEDEHRLSATGDMPWPALRNFAAALSAYKRDRHKLDFTDMLDRCHERLDVDLLVIDEAQDLTPQQWAFVRRAGATAPIVLVGGDDDQAIYDWAGADAGQMLRLRGNRSVLPISYRVPWEIKKIADRVAAGIVPRVEKTWSDRGEDGEVDRVPDIESVDLLDGCTWLLLARHRHQLRSYVEMCRRVGVVYFYEGRWSNDHDAVRAVVAYERLRRGGDVGPKEARRVASYVVDMAVPFGEEFYTWETMPWPWARTDDRPDWMKGLTRMGPEDREYIRELRRNGERMTGPGRVTISTVHGAKGGEAQTVLLLSDVGRKVDLGTPADLRVLYVALTRAINRLLVVRPHTLRHWEI